MKTLTGNDYYPVTFLNGDEEHKERGKKHLLGRRKDLAFFIQFGLNDDMEETKDRIREQFMEFSEIREALIMADNVGDFYNYGLSFDFVEAGTFDDQKEGYYRYQFSWGGPSDELRIYQDGTIVYVFLDWFVGVGFNVTNDEVFEWFVEDLKDIEMIDFESLDPEQLYNFEDEEEE